MGPQLSPTTLPPRETQRATSVERRKTPSSKKTAVKEPDTPLRSSRTATEEYRAGGLGSARRIVREDIGHVIRLPIDYLWAHCTLVHSLDDIRTHFSEQDWLRDGKWYPEMVSKDNLDGQRDLLEYAAFKPLADIFNQILAYSPTVAMEKGVRTMIHAGSTSPKSDRISTNRPDAFLLMSSGVASSLGDAPAAGTPYPVHWRDLTCPFEYKFGDGDKIDVRPSIYSPIISDDGLQNQDKLIWSLHHELRSDARRAFSFGVTVDGTKFRVWLGCRVALFNFPSIDWFEVCQQLSADVPFLMLIPVSVPGSTSKFFYLPRLLERI